jgi:hypothetical protein
LSGELYDYGAWYFSHTSIDGQRSTFMFCEEIVCSNFILRWA